MTAFDARFKARCVPSLLSRFGETIVYHPRNGKPRNITAIVDRAPPELLMQTDGVAPKATFEVSNDEHDGIASHLYDKGGDKVEIALRVGATPEQRSIVLDPNHDGAMCRFEVR